MIGVEVKDVAPVKMGKGVFFRGLWWSWEVPGTPKEAIEKMGE